MNSDITSSTAIEVTTAKGELSNCEEFVAMNTGLVPAPEFCGSNPQDM